MWHKLANERKVMLIKGFHIFMVLLFMGAVIVCAHSALTGYFTLLTWGGLGLVLVEGLVLISRGWVCPLTDLAERYGAENGSVTQYLMPKWMSDKAFEIWGAAYVVSALGILARVIF